MKDIHEISYGRTRLRPIPSEEPHLSEAPEDHHRDDEPIEDPCSDEESSLSPSKIESRHR